jgi:hypothetical protein
MVFTVAAAQDLPIGAVQPAPEAFTDVPADHWAYEAVHLLLQQGIVLGYPDGTFGGARPITRFEMAVIAARLLQHLDSLIRAAALDAATIKAMQETAAQLAELQPLERIAQLEQALEEAAALAYVERLERRIADLEAAMNELLGEEVFPREGLEGVGVPRTAAEALRRPGVAPVLPPDERKVPDATVGVDAPIWDLSPGRAFFGLSPGALTSGLIYLGVQAGYDRLLGPLGVVVRAHYNGAANDLRLSFGVLARTAIAPRLDGYGGLSAGVTITGQRTAALFEAPFGIEYYLSNTVGLFAQLLPSYTLTDNPVSVGLGVGLNLRF